MRGRCKFQPQACCSRAELPVLLSVTLVSAAAWESASGFLEYCYHTHPQSLSFHWPGAGPRRVFLKIVL